MSNQWKPLPMMDSQSSTFGNFPRQQQQQQQGGRQITKNPGNMFQSLPMGGGGGGGGSGFNPSPPSPNSPYGGRMSNGGGMSPSFNSGGGGGLTRLLSGGGGGNNFMDPPNSSYGMGGSVARMEPRLSPNNLMSSSNGGGGFSGGGAGSAFTNLTQQQQQHRGGGGGGINGFESTMSGGGGGFDRGGGGGGGFDRSMSTANGFMGNDGFGGRGGGGSNYDRQMSAPNLRDQYGSGGGGGGYRSMNEHRGGEFGPRNSGGNANFFVGDRGGGRGGNNSPPMYGKNDAGGMTIGTWNDVPTSSNSGGGARGGGYGSGGGGGGGNSMNFEIGTFNIGTFNGDGGGGGGGSGNNYGSSSSNSYSQSGHNIQGGPGIRETGIIEKLLHSYGFIQCCDRQARLFFHFSQFDGNIEHLKIGDPVEFEMTYDRRTGKPIASLVSKIAPDVVMSEERVFGTVTTEARLDSETGQETQGRISYENRGECFFLPFTLSDVEGNVTVAAGDKVSFQMATMARSGNLVARTIRLENPASPVKYQGVINSIKDSFGFIERADVVREIFFHFTEMEDGRTPSLGDDVEFTIQTRNGKEVACNIKQLPSGTVVFEDIGTEYFKGQVLKPLDRNKAAAAAGADGSNAGQNSQSQQQQPGQQPQQQEGEVLNGRIKYRGTNRAEEEVQFGEKDQVGDFTLRHGDWVRFVIAVDRRDKLKRATKIELMDESFAVSDERREQGMVQAIKDGFGFIRCADRDARMFFHFSEVLDVRRTIATGDEVEFTVASDPNQPKRQLAIRIKHLEPGIVKFDVIIHTGVRGVVSQEPSASAWNNKGNSANSPSGGQDGSQSPRNYAGRILYSLNGLPNLEIPLYANDCDLRNFPLKDDTVQFDINQCKATKETNAINVVIVERAVKQPPSPPPQAAAENSSQEKNQKSNKEVESSGSGGANRNKQDQDHKEQKGFVAALKDGFGFLETEAHDKEIFFHFSNVNGNPEKLEVGTEVRYTVYNREKGGKPSAENVTVIEKGSIPGHPVGGSDEVLHGKVVRSLRAVNPDQDEYCGLIQVKEEDGSVVGEYQFAIVSLRNKKELLQIGDPVQFHPSKKEPKFAVNIKSTKEKQRAYVEAMKGQFGFLSFEAEEGKKLFFHTTEVEDGQTLQTGDEVEFVVVTNKRSGKHSACCVRKISSSKRPDRLISKLKTMNLEDLARGGKRIVVVRQPRGPDNSPGAGFKARRK